MSLKEISAQKRVDRILSGAVKNLRIPNAYLFVGPEGSGKLDTALRLAKTLNCENGDGCDECASCKKIDSGIHPDVLVINSDGAAIGIDSIRELRSVVRYGPSQGKIKTIIINGADAFTIEAANAFLKVLEEPAPKILFILISGREDALVPTIPSRCQKIIFSEAIGSMDSSKIDSETGWILEEFDLIRQKSIVELLSFSSFLLSQKENIEQLLDVVLFNYWQQLKENKAAKDVIRIVLDAKKSIKQRSNLRLTLDNMCLKLKGVLSDAKVSN